MSRLTAENQASPYPSPGETWREGSSLAERVRSEMPSTGGLGLGLIVAGALGALAWYYLGPDLRRYLKIRNM